MALDCQACGACCFSTLTTYVAVSGDDYERLDDAAAALTAFHGIHCHMRMREGHCAALVLDPKRGTFSCSVYEQRPAICRELGRGSPACEAERSQKLTRTHHALEQLAR